MSLSIDTGGTFTDGFLTDGVRASHVKVDTTPDDLSRGVMACVDAAAFSWEATRSELLRGLNVVRLSTTIGTNTLINRTGPSVGLLIGSSLEAARRSLAAHLPLPPDGIEAIPDVPSSSSEPEVLAAVHRLLERGARILVICLGGAAADLAHREDGVRDLIAVDYPRHYLGAVPVLPAHQVTACPDPVVRIHTAVVNAYLHPVMSRFLYRVEDDLRASGYPHPLLIANADGGTSRVAKTTAIRTWGSGPAGGVAGAAEMARRLGSDAVVTLDVGGTSSDIAVVADGRWQYAVQPDIEAIPVSLPVLELISVGVGGGSIIRWRDGHITVGPDSAGAKPGPACFGLGGDAATVTDAALALGILDAERYLGGRKALDVEAGRAALQPIADAAGLDVRTVARDAFDAAAAVIAGALDDRLRRSGLTARSTSLFATGGAGGLLAGAVADAAGLRDAVAFPLSPVFSAFGLSRLAVAHAYEFSPPPVAEIEARVAAVKARAIRDMASEGIGADRVVFKIEVEVDGDGAIEPRTVEEDELAGLSGETSSLVRLVRLRAHAEEAPGDVPIHARVDGAGSPRQRLLHWAEAAEEVPVISWHEVADGDRFDGPALLESDTTTVLIPYGTRVRIGRWGEAVLQRMNARASVETTV